jgi:hypothetical protein
MTNVLPEKNGINFVNHYKDVLFGRRPTNNRNAAEPRSIGSRAIALALETPNNPIIYVTIKQEKLLRNSKLITLEPLV